MDRPCPARLVHSEVHQVHSHTAAQPTIAPVVSSHSVGHTGARAMLRQLILPTYILYTVTLNDIYDSLHPKTEMPYEMSDSTRHPCVDFSL